MFRSQQRKTKILFGLSDIFLTAIAFEIAYRTRQSLHFELVFYLLPDIKTLLLGFCIVTWLASGYWLNVYGKLDAARLSVILRDSSRQVSYGALALFVFIVFYMQMNISRVFLTLFIFLSWLFLVSFRIAARNLIPVVSRAFGVK